MSEYESLREDIGQVAASLAHYSATAVGHLLEQSRQIDKLWSDNAALRDDLHALANRVETLTPERSQAVSEKEYFTAQAERAASAILAEHGTPDTYDVAHALVSLGYMQGARDELAMLPGRVDEILTTILESVGVERETTTYYYVCDKCGSLANVTSKPLSENAGWRCDKCESPAFWQFTDETKALEHAAMIADRVRAS